MRYFTRAGIFLLVVFIGLNGCKEKTDGPYFATGIKIGEVTKSSAIVWVRLTTDSLPKGFENPLPIIKYIDPASGEFLDEVSGEGKEYAPVVSYPEGYDITTVEGATTGIEGDVMVYYKSRSSEHWLQTNWVSVSQGRDFTTQIELPDLSPNNVYELRVISRYPDSEAIGESINGKFKTAPAESDVSEVLFAVSTGQAYIDQDAPEGGFKIYSAMLKLGVDFFVHTGDILYYDRLAKSEAMARWHWSRTYSLSTNFRFHRNVTSYFIKDDHDTWINDCWPGYETRFMGDFTFEQGQAIFREQVPMGDKTYRTYRWGKDLQIWLMEGRDFRSPNTDPDGPEKTIWGKEQKDWFFNTVQQSDATFKILISPTPIVGPDRLNKHDNHSNKDFTHEGNEVRQFIASQKNMFVVCGDRHWQYISKDPETGVKEYSCGPASNEHAGGWSNDKRMPKHEYLNVTGGFLAVQTKRTRAIPTIIMTHYSVDGEVLNSETLSAH